MKKLLVVVFAFFAIPLSLLAQKTIKGKVTDEDGIGVPGANIVQVGGTRKGTQTDKDGNFSIAIKESGKVNLTVSSVGYGTKVVSVSGEETSIILEKKVSVQDEVVVVGYQQVKRGDINGAVSSVTAEQIKDVPATTGAEALTGRAAGVQVTSSEGGPGADYDIKLRGGTSITQDQTPLYIVDGIPVDNALSVISPQDIQSFDILKDAAATAIYGSRGANGVIVITTKGGKANKKLTVSYNAFVGWKEIANTLDVMSPGDFVKYQYEQLLKSTDFTKDSSSFARKYGTVVKDPLTGDGISDMFTAGHVWDSIKAYENTPAIDWQDRIFGRKAFQQQHNITLNGGTKNTTYNVSMTLNKEDGILIGTDFTRYLASVKLDHKVNNKLKIGTSIRFNNQVLNGAGVSQDGGSKDGVNFSRLRHVVKYVPFENAFFKEGENDPRYTDPDPNDPVDGAGQGVVNPYLNIIQEKKRNEQTTMNLNGQASYDLTKWLSFKTQVGIEMRNQFINYFYDSVTSFSRTQGGEKPIGQLDSIQRMTITNSNVLSYTNAKSKGKFKKNNSLQILLGQETIKQDQTTTQLQARFYPSYSSYTKIWDNILGSYPNSIAGGYPNVSKWESSLLSFFTKVNYAYKSKYLASFSYRADGSSKFADGRRWGYFPSGSLAWRISKENFMQKVNFISDLKIRATYGEAGNNRILDYGYVPTFLYTFNSGYALLNQAPGNAYYPNSGLLANSFIKWETTVSKNLGVDLALFNNRFQLSVDAYENTSNDLLILLPVPPTSGYSNQYQNVGATSNKGLEFQLSVPNILNKKAFTWGANFNISFNKNTVKSLSRLPSLTPNSGINSYNPADFIIKVGQPLGQIYGYINDGFYSPDDFVSYDADKKQFVSAAGTLYNNTGMAPDATDKSNAQPGTIKFKDLDGNDTLDLRDQTIIGNTNPKFYGGLNQQFAYKNFDLSVFVNFVYGNDVYNANKVEFVGGYNPDANMMEFMKDRFTNMDDNGNLITDLNALKARNANAKYWDPFAKAPGWSAMSWAVEDASFLRINNVTLGYNFKPRKIAKNIRAYITASNLAVFTNYSGFDPEVNAKRSVLTPGVDYSAYPKSRSYILGVNVNF